MIKNMKSVIFKIIAILLTLFAISIVHTQQITIDNCEWKVMNVKRLSGVSSAENLTVYMYVYCVCMCIYKIQKLLVIL